MSPVCAAERPARLSTIAGRRVAARGGLFAGVLVLACCASAHATFPGVNWRIAYTSVRSDQTKVVNSRLDGSGELNTSSDTDENITPAWSPDARHIAFVAAGCDGSCSIEVADANGANRDTVASGSELSDPAWSPDGTRLSWVDNSGTMPKIVLASTAGAVQRTVTLDGFIGVRQPTWSPDGRWIAFLGETVPCGESPCITEAVYRIPVQAPPEAPPTAVLSVTPAVGFSPLSVTADVSGSTDPDDTPIETYMLDWGDGSAPGTQTDHRYTTPGVYTVTLTVTDTGGRSSTATQTVAVLVIPGPNAIPRRAVARAAARQSEPEQLSAAVRASTIDSDGVSWSPDSATIAFSAGGMLFTIPTTTPPPGGHALNEISVSPSPAADPAWSPDGAKLAYVSQPAGEEFSSSIWIVPASGGAGQQFPAGSTSYDYAPDWQPARRPVATITGGPGGSTDARAARFSFSAGSYAATPGSPTFACALDQRDRALRPCSGAGEDSVSGLAPGQYTFRVVPTDADGLTGDAVTQSWTVRKHPAPHTRIVSGPAGRTGSRSATFTFTADETGVTFECALDGGPWRACSSATPDVVRRLGIGAHRFEVRATNDDQVMGSPQAWRWTVLPPRLPAKTTARVHWWHPSNAASVEILMGLRVLHAPAGVTVQAVCRGPGCPRQTEGRWRVGRAGTASLAWVAVRRALRPTASVDVRISKPGFTGIGRLYCVYSRGGRARVDSLAYTLGDHMPKCTRVGPRR